MKQYIEFIPVALFFTAFFVTRNLYTATVVLMASICVQVAIEYISTRKIGTKTNVIFWVAMVLGGATLIFHNAMFLKWKPTVVNWLFAAGLLASQFAGRENLLKKMFHEQLTLPPHVWRNLTLGWSFGFFVAGVLNLVVAYNFSLTFWVSYKLIGGISITLIYSIITVTYLIHGGYLQDEAQDQEGEEAKLKVEK